MSKMKLSEFVETNPKIKLDKGEEYEFVEMADVTPGKRHVYSQRKRKLKGGGSKFQSGDVLFARITPCLEHGKIAQFKSDLEKPAFGSTEFFVFRKKEGVSNQDYVFYLSLTDTIRKPAEKSMVGASGRQRAKLETVRNIEFNAPELPEQQKIASILSNYDNLIENNTKRIQLLEKMAKLIYDEWFVKFKFPGHEKVKMVGSELEKIPERREKGVIKDLYYVQPGFAFKSKHYSEEGSPIIKIKNIHEDGSIDIEKVNRIPFDIIKDYDRFKLDRGDLLIAMTGATIGKVGLMPITDEPFYLNQRVARFIPKIEKRHLYYLYFYLTGGTFRKTIENISLGAAQPNISGENVENIKLLKPDINILNEFCILVEPLFSEILNLRAENQNLRKTRDLLLPKLISGQVDISDLDIKVPEMQEVVV